MDIIDKSAQKELLQIARKTLVEYVTEMVPSLINPRSRQLQKCLGAFVTLYNNSLLRGCIGTFEAKTPVYKTVQEMTISSCSKDPRFIPISSEELSRVKIEITVISQMRKTDNWKNIKLGVHGVYIKNGISSGTFLPQVATDTGWNLEEFLGQLCENKAGLERECYKDQNTEIYVYDCQIIHEEYE
jgi:AmmeMemoRadiSam system protein A